MTSARFALKKRSTDRMRSVDSHPRFSAPIVRANTRHSSRASGGMLAASSLERFRFAGARVGGVVTAAATRGGADELASPRPRAAPRSGTKKHRDDDDVFDDARKRPRDVTTADAPSTPPQPSTKPPPPSPLSQASVARTPFIAPSPARWRERYAPTCEACERDRKHCAHHAEVPLKLLIIGHNPSDHSWESGYSYSNPSNNMWKLLVRGEIIPSAWTSDDCPRLAGELGIGFTDAGTEPGNDANAYGRAVMKEWREDLYARLRGHLCRASGRAIGGEEGDVADEIDDAAKTWRATAAAFGPSVVAFAGKAAVRAALRHDPEARRGREAAPRIVAAALAVLRGRDRGVGVTLEQRSRGDDERGAGDAVSRARREARGGGVAAPRRRLSRRSGATS